MNIVDKIKNIFEKFAKTKEPTSHKSYDKKCKKTIDGMREAISKSETTNKVIIHIDEYINRRKSQKKSAIEVAIAFYDYIKKIIPARTDFSKDEKENLCDIIEKSTLFKSTAFDSPLFRCIEILKFLHGEKHTSERIAENFNIDQRTVRRCIREIQKCINIFSTAIKIEEKREGRRRAIYYYSTVHPFFLALNLTEVFALLRLLKEAEKDTYTGIIYKNLKNDISGQLSEYARRLLGKAGIDFPHENPQPQYRHEGASVRSCLAYALQYSMKSGKKICVTYSDKVSPGKFFRRMLDNTFHVQDTAGCSFRNAERREPETTLSGEAIHGSCGGNPARFVCLGNQADIAAAKSAFPAAAGRLCAGARSRAADSSTIVSTQKPAPA